jgi:hypothetical protein
MKISLLVPSRERLNLKLTLISSIITTVSDINNVELIFGIDEDDPTRDTVYKIASAIPFVKIVDIKNNGKFIGINRIWNILYPHAQGEILEMIWYSRPLTGTQRFSKSSIMTIFLKIK